MQQLRDRLRKWWWIKMLGTALGVAGFFIVYFWLLKNPLRPFTIMPRTGIDQLIAFHPVSLPLYISFWLYISLIPALLVDRRELISYVLAAIGLGVTGLAIFCAWPTAVPAADVDWSLYPAFSLLKSVDMAGNACPSMHVAFSVFTAVWLDRLIRQMDVGGGWRILNWVWCLAILYSTVASRQHVVLDVVAGTTLGLALGRVSCLLIDRSSDVRSVPGSSLKTPGLVG